MKHFLGDFRTPLLGRVNGFSTVPQYWCDTASENQTGARLHRVLLINDTWYWHGTGMKAERDKAIHTAPGTLQYYYSITTVLLGNIVLIVMRNKYAL